MYRSELTNMKWQGDLSLADASVIATLGKQSKRILEFGVGGSTQILSQCMPDVLISIDTSQDWIDITKTKLQQITTRSTVSFFNYDELDIIINTCSSPFDMIFVDGVDQLRLEFAIKTWNLLAIGGAMVFHDTRRSGDVANVLNTVLTNFTEVNSITLNVADSSGTTSNVSVIRKKVAESYENWNLVEDKPMSAYHAHMCDIDTPLWEYSAKSDDIPDPLLLREVDLSSINLAIYSTYCGSSKNITFNHAVPANYPQYFISNNQEVLKTVEELGWIPLFLEGAPVSDDPVISATQAKIAKVSPHLFPELTNYDFLFYIDDKITLNESVIPDMVNLLIANNASTAMKKHPFIDANVLYEYTASIKQSRYYAQQWQMSCYIAEQVKNGMKLTSNIHFVTGCILRDMRHPDTLRINKLWEEHVQQCGIECQVSFFFVAQHFPNIMILPINITR